MFFRIGCFLLMPLLFAEWTDDVLAAMLPAEAIPVCSVPSEQPATLFALRNRYDLQDRMAALPFACPNGSNGCRNNPSEQTERIEPADGPLPSSGDLIYRLMSLQR